MAGIAGRVEKPGLIQKLYTRFSLLLGSGAKLHLSNTIQLVSNADELVSALQTSKVTGYDTSQAAGVVILVDTVPSGKQWKVWVLEGRRTAGVAALTASVLLGKVVGGSANSSNFARVSGINGDGGNDYVTRLGGILMNPGDQIGLIIVTTEAGSTFEVDYTYEERYRLSFNSIKRVPKTGNQVADSVSCGCGHAATCGCGGPCGPHLVAVVCDCYVQ